MKGSVGRNSRGFIGNKFNWRFYTFRVELCRRILFFRSTGLIGGAVLASDKFLILGFLYGNKWNFVYIFIWGFLVHK